MKIYPKAKISGFLIFLLFAVISLFGPFLPFEVESSIMRLVASCYERELDFFIWIGKGINNFKFRLYISAAIGLMAFAIINVVIAIKEKHAPAKK